MGRLFLIVLLEHRASQYSPETDKNAPKKAPASLQQAFKEAVLLFFTTFLPENDP